MSKLFKCQKTIFSKVLIMICICIAALQSIPSHVTAASVNAGSAEEEMKAMWISYLDFDNFKSSKGYQYTENQFAAKVDEMFDNCVKWGMNTVIVQVRPFADAMYDSQYFPWSRCASGKQGKAVDYDPLTYMVDAAHERGLSIQAWINPYRVTSTGTSKSLLSADNQARKWMESTKESEKRNVLSFGKKLFYNPAKEEVQDLVINGIAEIVENYDVDGIHFDDYFYPTLGSNYKKNFDYKEYNTYKADCTKKGITPLSIVNWRRENVNQLVRNTYRAIKEINPEVEFGISPAGSIDNLKSSQAYYVDIDTWLTEPGYIDYICPQIYWSFQHATHAFDKVTDRWLSLDRDSSVKMYLGIASYRAGSDLDPGWKKYSDVLKKQVLYGRETGEVDGYMFFRYDSFHAKTTKATQKEIKNLLPIL